LPGIPLVCLIHDSYSAQRVVETVIRSAGFDVEVFGSAEQFILSNHMSGSACLVIDSHLPGMSGGQLQSHLASAGRYIPMIFVTASDDRKARELAVASGAVCLRDRTSGYGALLEAIRLILKPRDPRT
jgi:FixJ family two-component response regulator